VTGVQTCALPIYWYQEAAEAKGLALSKEESREIIYGMPYDAWKERYQTEASPASLETLAKNRPHH
jgi:hypothetical protein